MNCQHFFGAVAREPSRRKFGEAGNRIMDRSSMGSYKLTSV